MLTNLPSFKLLGSGLELLFEENDESKIKSALIDKGFTVSEVTSLLKPLTKLPLKKLEVENLI